MMSRTGRRNFIGWNRKFQMSVVRSITTFGINIASISVVNMAIVLRMVEFTFSGTLILLGY